MNAVDIIRDAYGRCNRLSPGETLNADDIARGFFDLNIIADELSAKRRFLYKMTFTSAAQTGNITLGAGSWAAIPVGAKILYAYVNDEMIAETTPERFAALIQPVTNGLPTIWSYNGFDTVSLYPLPTGETVKLATATGVTEFADTTTQYFMPPGYKSYLGARLAIKEAMIIASMTPLEMQNLAREETKSELAIRTVRPAILDVDGYTTDSIPDTGNILNGWN